ncbi:ABC transporter ATP-binding protein [Pseudalkalibacillus salsuginis]|uniref:ABC transporter ATP-binding protein n=1 Tax=Pseudalkalibacillus salsuginis TaxID=2910972 RepID=UPI001F21F2A0|nr:ABC transporter ATP-binding protein [Pseudalkalibacillus salsuginis]MCF6411422.1 ABC transporter ATP-binding protein [Pseudalkalibacillus salsuginis]
MQNETMVDVKGLVKRYGSLVAVNEVTFKVNKGEIFGLLGPNGAGKTTTIEMLVGLRKPDEGTATLAGFDVRKQVNQVKGIIGVQLQSTSLFELLKVEEILHLYASFYPSHIDIPQLISDMLLAEKRTDRIKSLSGGQKQRLAIALALIHDPNIVFLDEPTTGLDPQARRTLWDIVLRLKERGKTVILSTHYMDEAHVLCDRIGIMDQGELIALDTPTNLVKKLQSTSTVEFRLTNPPEQAWFMEMDGVEEVSIKDTFVQLYTDDLQLALISLIQISAEHNLNIEDLQTRTATLEDVFIHMTGRSLRES